MFRQIGMPLNRIHQLTVRVLSIMRELAQDRRLETGTRTDLERPVSRSGIERLGHQRHHVGLADRLASANRQRRISVCPAPVGRVYKCSARYAGEGISHPLMMDFGPLVGPGKWEALLVRHSRSAHDRPVIGPRRVRIGTRMRPYIGRPAVRLH